MPTRERTPIANSRQAPVKADGLVCELIGLLKIEG